MKDMTLILIIPLIGLHMENPVHMVSFSLVACTPRQVHSHMTSNSDMREVDLEMQMKLRTLASLLLTLGAFLCVMFLCGFIFYFCVCLFSAEFLL